MVGHISHRFLSFMRDTVHSQILRVSGVRCSCIMRHGRGARRQCKFSPTGTIILISRNRNFALPGINIPGGRTWRQYAPFILGVRKREFVSGPFCRGAARRFLARKRKLALRIYVSLSLSAKIQSGMLNVRLITGLYLKDTVKCVTIFRLVMKLAKILIQN